MDDKNARAGRPAENLISRPPTQADLIKLCRELNQRGAKYVVVGGWVPNERFPHGLNWLAKELSSVTLCRSCRVVSE
jgi:hypothetical protein